MDDLVQFLKKNNARLYFKSEIGGLILESNGWYVGVQLLAKEDFQNTWVKWVKPLMEALQKQLDNQ